MTNGNSGGEKGRTVVTISVAVFILITIVGVLYWYYVQRIADEPPIHVKNGSLLIQLESQSGKFKWVYNKKDNTWKMNDGEKKGSTYTVTVSQGSGAHCTQLPAIGNPVKVSFSDNTSATFTIDKKHTVLSTSIVFTQPADDTVSHETEVNGDHITELSVGGTQVCTFETKDSLLGLTLDK
jgi:hypothetical protein